jgi:CubicO group peptidase (beta-lactamase class C family)
MTMNRRRFLQQATLAAAAFSAGAAPSQPLSEAFDEILRAYMEPRAIPGGALAVVKDRRLVYARAYGWADRQAREPARVASLFRIASISKPFTAVAVLKLISTGQLEMDAPAFNILQLEPLPGQSPDARLSRITVRHLLHHTAGWDRDHGGDPMFMSDKIARANGEPPPANQSAIIRYMLGQPLDFDPGSRFAYSNFGYCVLGRIIEKISGQEYAAFVQREVLQPIGIRRMRLGVSRESGRAPDEVKYYMPASDPPSAPYTGFYLEAMDSHGGWLASAVDLVRFAAALDDPAPNSWLPLETRPLLCEPPAPPVSREANGALTPVFYGCGWNVRPIGQHGRANYWHNGSLPGTSTLLVRRHDGLTWAVLFNQRSSDPKLPDNEIDGALHRAADSVAAWPSHDLFPQYP